MHGRRLGQLTLLGRGIEMSGAFAGMRALDLTGGGSGASGTILGFAWVLRHAGKPVQPGAIDKNVRCRQRTGYPPPIAASLTRMLIPIQALLSARSDAAQK